MKTSILAATAGAVALSFAALTPVHAGVVGPMNPIAQTQEQAKEASDLVHQVGRRGRRALAAGIITLGVLGAIAASRAHDRHHYYERRYTPRRRYYRNKCRRWLRNCRYGNDRACWRYDTRC